MMTQEIMRQLRRRRGALRGRGEEAAVSLGPTPAPPDVAPQGTRTPGPLSQPGGTALVLTPSLLLSPMGVSRHGEEREVGLHAGKHQGDGSGVPPAPHPSPTARAAPQGALGAAPWL